MPTSNDLSAVSQTSPSTIPADNPPADPSRSLVREVRAGGLPDVEADRVARRTRLKGAPTLREYTAAANVSALAISSDGAHLAVGSKDGKVALYNTSTGQQLHTLRYGSWVRSVAFSPDGKRVVIGGHEKTAAVYGVLKGALEHALQHSSWVRSVAFSPDGSRIAFGGKGSQAAGELVVHDASSGERLYTRARGGLVFSVAFSPDGARLAVGGEDQRVAVYDARAGELQSEWSHGLQVSCVAFSPDGSRLAALGLSKGTVYDALTGAPSKELAQPKYGLFSLAFSPDGTRIALGGGGGMGGGVRLIDAWTGELLAEPLRGREIIRAVVFSPEGSRVLAGGDDRRAAVLDVSAGEQLHELRRENKVFTVAYSPDGSCVAVGGEDRKVGVYDPSSGELRYELRREALIRRLAYSPDGAQLLVAGGAKAAVYSTSTRKVVRELARGGEIISVAFAADCSRVALGGRDMKAGVYDASTGELQYELTRGDQVWSVAFSPDGAHLAVGGRDRRVGVYNTTSRTLIYTLSRADAVEPVAFSPDGAQLAVGGLDRKLAMYDASSGELKYELTRGDALMSLAFSPDGTQLMAGGWDKKAALYDACTGELRYELMRGDLANTVAFSPDGTQLAFVSYDRVVLARAGLPVLSLLPRSAAALTHAVRCAAAHAEPASGQTLAEMLVEEGETAVLRQLVRPKERPPVLPPVAFGPGSFALAVEHNNVAGAELLFEAALRPTVPTTSAVRTATALAIPALVADGQARLVARVMSRLVVWRQDAPPFQARALHDPTSADGSAAAQSTAVPQLSTVLHAGSTDWFSTRVWRAHVVAHPHGARAVAHTLPMPCITCGVTLRALVRVDSGAMWGGEALRAACEAVWLGHLRAFHLTLCAALLLEAALFSAACAEVVWPDVAAAVAVGGTRSAAALGVNLALALVALSLLGVEARQAWAVRSRAARAAAARAAAAPPSGAPAALPTSAAGAMSASSRPLDAAVVPTEQRPSTAAANEPPAEQRRRSRSASRSAAPHGEQGMSAPPPRPQTPLAAAARRAARGLVAVRRLDPLAVIDWVSQLLVLACALYALALPAAARSPPLPALLHALALASLGLLGRSLKAMRGFERLTHFVDVLAQSFRDMAPLLFICGVLIFFFALAFAAQFEPVAHNADDPLADGMAALLTRPQWFLLGAFNMGMLGDFSVGPFEEAASPTLTTVMFVAQMIFLMVVALNALIALLGDTYDRVTELQDASRNKQRARLILEYYDLLPYAWVEDIEVATTWLHRLAPVALVGEGDDGAPNEDETWRGRLTAISHKLEESLEKQQQRLKQELKHSQHELRQQLEQGQRQLERKLEQSQQRLEAKLEAVSEAVQALTRHLAPAGVRAGRSDGGYDA